MLFGPHHAHNASRNCVRDTQAWDNDNAPFVVCNNGDKIAYCPKATKMTISTKINRQEHKLCKSTKLEGLEVIIICLVVSSISQMYLSVIAVSVVEAIGQLWTSILAFG